MWPFKKIKHIAKVPEIPTNYRDPELKRIKLEMDFDYECRLSAYNLREQRLKEQREQFYKENPDFPYKSMFMSVTAPPCKISIEFVD